MSLKNDNMKSRKEKVHWKLFQTVSCIYVWCSPWRLLWGQKHLFVQKTWSLHIHFLTKIRNCFLPTIITFSLKWIISSNQVFLSCKKLPVGNGRHLPCIHRSLSVKSTQFLAGQSGGVVDNGSEWDNHMTFGGRHLRQSGGATISNTTRAHGIIVNHSFPFRFDANCRNHFNASPDQY